MELAFVYDVNVVVAAEDLQEVGKDDDGLSLQSLLAWHVGRCSRGSTRLVLAEFMLILKMIFFSVR